MGTTPYFIRFTRVHRDGVEFGDGQRIDVEPRLGPIVREIEPAISSQHNAIRVIGIDEHVVIVAVRSIAPSFIRKHWNGPLGDNRLGLTCIGGIEKVETHDKDLVFVVWHDPDQAEIVTNSGFHLTLMGFAPAFTLVVGSIDFAPNAAVVTDEVKNIRIRGCDRDPHSANLLTGG